MISDGQCCGVFGLLVKLLSTNGICWLLRAQIKVKDSGDGFWSPALARISRYNSCLSNFAAKCEWLLTEWLGQTLIQPNLSSEELAHGLKVTSSWS